MKNEMPNLKELIEMPGEGKELARKMTELEPEFRPNSPYVGDLSDLVINGTIDSYIELSGKYKSMWEKNLGVDDEFLMNELGFSEYTLENVYCGTKNKVRMIGAVEKLFGNDLTDRTVIAFRTYSDDSVLSKTFAAKNAKTISYGNAGYAPNVSSLCKEEDKPENEQIVYGGWNDLSEIKDKADIMVFYGDPNPRFAVTLEEDEEKPERDFKETGNEYQDRYDKWKTNYGTKTAKIVDDSLKPGGVFLQVGEGSIDCDIFEKIGYTTCYTKYFTIVQKPNE